MFDQARQEQNPTLVDRWLGKFVSVVIRLNNGEFCDAFCDIALQDLIVRVFRPEYVVMKALEIAGKMEELGSSDN